MSSGKESMWGFTAWGQSSVNELSSRVKERWEVKCRQVTGGNSIVFHRGTIKVIISLAAEFPMCSVQDMGDSQLPEPQLVVRHEPDTRVMHVEQFTCTEHMSLKGTNNAHMSPKYRCGHTSSQWRQERRAECKTSSSSWIVGIFLILLDSSAARGPHCFFSAGFVSRTVSISVSCGSSLAMVEQSKIGFPSAILMMKRHGTFFKPKSCYSLLPPRWQAHQSNIDCRKQVVQVGTACQFSLVKPSSQCS